MQQHYNPRWWQHRSHLLVSFMVALVQGFPRGTMKVVGSTQNNTDAHTNHKHIIIEGHGVHRGLPNPKMTIGVS